MYFPILRGRQNELLAIRELQDEGRLSHVTPIIEPVKASPTLLSVLRQFREAGKELVLVANPRVGSFEKELNQDPGYVERLKTEVEQSDQLVEMYYCSEREWLTELLCCLPPKRMYYLETASKDAYCSMRTCEKPFYTIVSAGGQRLHRIAEGKKIVLESAFKPQSRNADYFDHDSDFLTEELFYFEEEGYFGFSDFSVIGEDYNEGGFAPVVVALHLAHLGEDGKSLCVRHFVSQKKTASERGKRDIAGKFHEALEALVEWASDHPRLVPKTLALGEMQACYEGERFPGLGVAKKMAIKHHLEMVNMLLEGLR